MCLFLDDTKHFCTKYLVLSKWWCMWPICYCTWPICCTWWCMWPICWSIHTRVTHAVCVYVRGSWVQFWSIFISFVKKFTASLRMHTYIIYPECVFRTCTHPHMHKRSLNRWTNANARISLCVCVLTCVCMLTLPVCMFTYVYTPWLIFFFCMFSQGHIYLHTYVHNDMKWSCLYWFGHA